jgi:DNA-binding transcriptional regulator YhcF (GntR family)
MAAEKIKPTARNIGLEQLFGSRTRVKLLKLFLNSGDKLYFVREIARALNSQINSIRRELMNLKDLGIIREVQPSKESYLVAVKDRKNKFSGKFKRVGRKDALKKFFQANEDFILFPELKALLLKADFLLEKSFVRAIQRTGNIDYFVLTGNFVGLPTISVDLLLVGRFNRRRLARLVRAFEKDFGREINYTVMSRQEFKYRKDITDRFLYDILENKKIVMVNELGIK